MRAISSLNSPRNYFGKVGPRPILSKSPLGERLIRAIFGTETYRLVPCPDPDNIPAHSNATWSDSRKRKSSSWPVRTQFDPVKRHVSIIQNLFQHRQSKLGYLDLSQPLRHNVPSKARNINNSSISSKDQHVQSEQSVEELSAVPKLTHLNSDGEAHMVSIADKKPTSRSATATATLLFSKKQTYNALMSAKLEKGDAIAVARIAGIQAAKKTSDLIPLAHPGLGITGINTSIKPFDSEKGPPAIIWEDSGSKISNQDKHARLPNQHSSQNIEGSFGGVQVTMTVACEGKTGVEMEALTGASIAVLTLYDMLKGVDKAMVMTGARVIAKRGGKSGNWTWNYLTNEIVREEPNKETAINLQHQEELGKSIRHHCESKQREVNEGSTPDSRESESRVRSADLVWKGKKVDRTGLESASFARWKSWESR